MPLKLAPVVSLEARRRLLASLQPRKACGPDWSPEVPHPKQQAFLLLGNCRDVLYGGAAAGGKLLPLTTILPTPRGWRQLGDLGPGDFLFGRDGRPHVIEAESKVQHVAGWEFTFDDGSTVVSNDDHRWLTFDTAERAALHRRSDAFRSKRRAGRPSRSAIGSRNGLNHTLEHRRYLSAAITERNQAYPRAPKPAPTGTMRTTAEILATLYDRRGAVNHAIPLAEPLDLPERDLPMDPYVLGVWLGDGTTKAGNITTMDEEVLSECADAGYRVARRYARSDPDSKAFTYRLDGLRVALRATGVLGDKHVPNPYLWASEAQRLALLQGLMDTDGGVEGRSVSFTNTNERLTRAVAHLARSLGMSVTVRESRAKLYGQDHGPKWTVKFAANRVVFRLSRKVERMFVSSGRTTKWRFIVAARPTAPTPMKCLRVSSPDHLFLVGEALIPTHNSSALLLAALQYVCVPGYAALLIRQTYPQLVGEDGLIDRARHWLAPHIKAGLVTWKASDKLFTFTQSGATIRFGHMQRDDDKYQYQGHAYQYVGLDELTHWADPRAYLYVGFSRVRRPAPSTTLLPCPTCGLTLADVPLRTRAGANPGGRGHSWVRQRYVIAPPTADRKFVPARIEDNPSLDRSSYIESLGELDPVERVRLLLGDWDVREDGRVFRRHWFTGWNVPGTRTVAA